MRKLNCDVASPRLAQRRVVSVTALLLLTGCATPQYALRPTPAPDESVAVVQMERAISAEQAKTFAEQNARPIAWGESLWGFDVPTLVGRLSQVTERRGLPYQAWLYEGDDPNAAALADGRVYLSSGMLDYLASRGSRVDELAFVVAHELAHTVAQHLIKRHQTLRQQSLLMSIVSLGTAAATRGASAGAHEAGQTIMDIASLLRQVSISGYSQQQELEADQLGIRYLQRAGYDPEAALVLLQDFTRFEQPGIFLRTHPYMARRRADLTRYLNDQASPTIIERLREAQQLYPVGSQSWQNLQRQIEAEQDYER